MTIGARNNLYFGLAVAVLAVSGGAMQWATSTGQLQLIKKSLPIRRALQALSREAFTPYEVVATKRLPPEMEEELGTLEYVNWVISEPVGTPNRQANMQFSVTYYTGVQDQVPHVAEECMFQGNFTQDTDDTLEMDLPRLGEKAKVRRLSFYSPKQVGVRTFVYYTICVNGSLYADRQWARWRMSDRQDTHLYYSKVELALSEQDGIAPAELDEKARAVLDRALSELVQSHWPVKGSERGGGIGGTDASRG